MNMIIRDEYKNMNGMTVRPFIFSNTNISREGLISCFKGFVTFQIPVDNLDVAIFFEAIDDDAVIEEATEVIGMIFDEYESTQANAVITQYKDQVIKCEINNKYGYTIKVDVVEGLVVMSIKIHDKNYGINCISKPDDFSDAELLRIPIVLALGRDKNDVALKQ